MRRAVILGLVCLALVPIWFATIEAITASPDEIRVVSAATCQGLTTEMGPLRPTTEFQPTQSVYFAVELDGRPRHGTVTARFYFYDRLLGEARRELHPLNGDVLFALGQDTQLGMWLDHEEPLPISGNYRVQLLVDDRLVSTHRFEILPPSDSLDFRLLRWDLARGATERFEPLEPNGQFHPDDEVHFVGLANVGRLSSLRVDWWYVEHPRRLDFASRTVTATANGEGVGFDFHTRPPGGWPLGRHAVVLTINDDIEHTYSFEVVPAPGLSAVAR